MAKQQYTTYKIGRENVLGPIGTKVPEKNNLVPEYLKLIA